MAGLMLGDSPHLNVAGRGGIDAPGDLHGETMLLTPGERRELLCHHSLLHASDAAEALAVAPGWEKDLHPFDWWLPSSEE